MPYTKRAQRFIVEVLLDGKWTRSNVVPQPFGNKTDALIAVSTYYGSTAEGVRVRTK